LLYRAERRGVVVGADRWAEVSGFLAEKFPKPGLAFADVHAALAHAMAGNLEGLARIIEGARGPAGDLVRVLAEAFGAIASGAWAEAEARLVVALRDHAVRASERSSAHALGALFRARRRSSRHAVRSPSWFADMCQRDSMPGAPPSPGVRIRPRGA